MAAFCIKAQTGKDQMSDDEKEITHCSLLNEGLKK